MEGEWTVEAMKTLWDLRGWDPFGNAETFGVWKLNTLSFNAIFWVFDNSYVKKRVLCFCTLLSFGDIREREKQKIRNKSRGGIRKGLEENSRVTTTMGEGEDQNKVNLREFEEEKERGEQWRCREVRSTHSHTLKSKEILIYIKRVRLNHLV